MIVKPQSCKGANFVQMGIIYPNIASYSDEKCFHKPK